MDSIRIESVRPVALVSPTLGASHDPNNDPRLPRCLAFTLAPAAASAGTIAYEGDTLVLTAGPGEANSITFGGEQAGRLSIADARRTRSPPTAAPSSTRSTRSSASFPRASTPTSGTATTAS